MTSATPVDTLMRYLESQHPRDTSGRWRRLAASPGPGTGWQHKGGQVPWHTSGTVAHYHGSLGIDRKAMPQLSGTLADGSYVPTKVMLPKFMDWLRGQGVAVHVQRVAASRLRPTQTTGDARVIRSIADDLKSGKLGDTKPATVSSDDRLLDAHHNWAGRLLADSEGGRAGLRAGMPVVRVGVPMSRLLQLAGQFAAEQGIRSRGTGETAAPAHRSRGLGWDEEAVRAGWQERLHPRVAHGPKGGQFTRRPGGAVVPAGGKPGGKPAGLRAESVDSDTVAKYMRPDGSWDPARQALHDQIVAKALAGHKRQAEPVATFLGGGPASGKSTVMAGQSGDRVHIDADAIKAQLPEYQQMTKAGDKRAAAHVHEESSYLAKRIQAGAVAGRMNFILDGTGNSDPDKMRRKVAAAKAAGHTVVAKYVTADTEEAVRRARVRAEQTGRMVPESVIREVHGSVSRVFKQLAEAGAFDAAELWDTNGREPVLVGEQPLGGKWTVRDQRAWQAFLDKAK